MSNGEREALAVVAAALGDACRLMQAAGNVDSPWHKRFTSTRHRLLGLLGGWERAGQQEAPMAPVVQLRAVPNNPTREA
jgi:hypothetical protein